MAEDENKKDGEQKTGTRDFNHQCYLNDFMTSFAIHNQGREYKGFKKVTGAPNEALNVLVGKKGIEKFFDLRPYQIAALQPQIRLFTLQLEKPPSDNRIKGFTELNFGQHSTDPMKTSNITNSKEVRGDGVGISSFDINTQGTNPAETGLVKCVLKLHFQHPGLLINPWTVKAGGPDAAKYRYLDLIWHVRGQVDTAQPQAARMGQRQQEAFVLDYKPQHNMLAVQYGWALPPGGMPAMGIKNEEEWRLIKDAISRSQTVIFLTLVQHSIEYNQDGTLNLEVEYQGAIESIISSPFSDVLSLTAKRHDTRFHGRQAETRGYQRDLEEIKQEREDLVERRKAADERAAGGWRDKIGMDTAEQDDLQAETALLDKEEKERKKWIQENNSAERTAMYTGLIDAIDSRAALKFFDLSKESVENWRKTTEKTRISDLAWKKLSDTEKQKYSRWDDGFYYKRRGGHVYEDEGQGPQNAARQVAGNQARGEVEGAVWGTNKVKPDEKQDLVDEAIKKTKALSEKAKGDGSERVHYIYLGEILDIAASVLKESTNPDVKNLSILVGSLEYTDVRGGRHFKKPRTVNLADIAISFEEFMIWFTDTVIRRDRQKYLFKDFVRDLCTKFVVAALGESCFTGTGPNRYTVGLSVFSAPGLRGGGDRIPGQKIEVQDLNRLDLQTLKISDLPPGDPGAALKDYQHYLYIYIVNSSPKFLLRSEEEDVKRGIYHVGLGRDAGLVKNIKFDKIDTPYLGEAKLTSADAQQTQLRHKYNVGLSMVGNSFFTPGQYIYVDPSMAGMGNPRNTNSLAFQLGLGGYYSITQVNSSLGKNGFSTDLTCVWESFGASEP